MKTIIAVDPGASGGFAIKDFGEPHLCAMPETEGDIEELIRITRHGGEQGTQRIAYVEQVGGFIKGNPAPGSAMFNFGRNFGFILGCLQAHGFRVELVTPQKWQKHFGLGTKSACGSVSEWKGKLKAKAQQLYPGVKVTNQTADALLILDYALNTKDSQ